MTGPNPTDCPLNQFLASEAAIHARIDHEQTDSIPFPNDRNDRPLRAASIRQKCATSLSRADKADRQSIEAFGFTNPILVSDQLEILAGHGRASAAQLIGMKQATVTVKSGAEFAASESCLRAWLEKRRDERGEEHKKALQQGAEKEFGKAFRVSAFNKAYGAIYDRARGRPRKRK